MNQITVYPTRPLRNHPYANATVVETEKGSALISYRTVVAQIADNKVFCYGLYSMTTRHHISAFAAENGLNYDIFKKVYEGGYEYYDISTDTFVD